MGVLPPQKKILREDLKDAPSWVDLIINPLNSFMENVYQTLNRNVTFPQNIACQIKTISYVTPSTYPTMDDLKFMSTLKTKATGVMLWQIVDANYLPPPGPVYVPWTEDNGSIVIKPLTGLVASKTYTLTLLVV